MRIVFLSFHIHIFDSDLHFELIHRQGYELIFFMGMRTYYVLIPQEISEIIESLGFKINVEHFMS